MLVPCFVTLPLLELKNELCCAHVRSVHLLVLCEHRVVPPWHDVGACFDFALPLKQQTFLANRETRHSCHSRWSGRLVARRRHAL